MIKNVDNIDLNKQSLEKKIKDVDKQIFLKPANLLWPNRLTKIGFNEKKMEILGMSVLVIFVTLIQCLISNDFDF